MRSLLAFSLVFAVACGAPEKKETAPPPVAAKPVPPTAEQAKTLLANSPEFSEYEFTNASYSLPLKKSVMNAPAQTAAKQLATAGWIRMKGDDVELTEKAASDRRVLVRQNGFVDFVPLARKEFSNVTGVRPLADGNVEVDFDWKWIPNEIGSAFTSGPVFERYAAPQAARATLMPSGDGWAVLRVEKR